MPKRTTLVLVIAAACGAGCATTCAGPSPAPAAVASSPAFAPVMWLHGAWAGTDDRGVRTEEYWTPARAGTMFGVNRVIAGGGTVFFENLRIEADADGGIVYLASPQGRQPPTSFRMVSAGPDGVVFENPEHDYPQRIIYRERQDGVLHMRIEGRENGRDKAGDWLLVRQ